MPYFLLAAGACLQWLVLRGLGIHPPQPLDALLPGLCTVGAAALITWAAEAAEMDIPQNLSIGMLALIAVLPEYAVDVYFAWTAGKHPAYAAYAAANMTGANRLLIGLGWPAVLLACWIRRGTAQIRLSSARAADVVVLFLATAYSFLLPLKASLSLWDSLWLLSLFVFYIVLASRSPREEPEIEGPAKLVAGLPRKPRRAALAGLFLFCAAAILASAKPFAEGLLGMGRRWGIEEFLLVQWLAPLASEAPEFIAAMLFSIHGKPEAGLKTLVSSKVNQWTVLVGMLPLAYCLSSHSLGAIPLDARQVEEMLLTSSQSLLALVVLMNLQFDLWEAGLLLTLFATQIFFPHAAVRYAFAALYLSLSLVLFALQPRRREQIRGLLAQVLRF